MSLSYTQQHTPHCGRRRPPKQEAIMLSKQDQARLSTLRAADLALRRDMERLKVRFD